MQQSHIYLFTHHQNILKYVRIGETKKGFFVKEMNLSPRHIALGAKDYILMGSSDGNLALDSPKDQRVVPHSET